MTRLASWLRALYCIFSTLVLFWLFCASAGDTLTITVPSAMRLTVEFVNAAHEYVEFYPETTEQRGRETAYTFTGLTRGETYLITLRDADGVIERTRVVAADGIAIDLRFVTTPDVWHSRAPVPM